MSYLVKCVTGLLVLFLGFTTGCVDQFDQTLPSSLNVIVIDGTITNLAEPQIIRLNRSISDPFSGSPGAQLITKATIEIVVDSGQVVIAHETTDGVYQLPSDFRGQIGHSYQLRFTLSDGTHYESTRQVMLIVPSIGKVTAQFNPSSLSAVELGGFTAAHDLYIDTQDPVNQTNYYRWDWQLWETQDWCRTCKQGQYSINNVLTLISANGLPYFQTGDSLLEDCFYPRTGVYAGQALPSFVYDYPCRSRCWAIISSHQLNIFADSYTNGGMISGRRVAQITFYQHPPCLVEIRQASLTPSAYRFYKQLQDQTQNTGGIADTPPTASMGNVQNTANRREIIVGFFTASAVSTSRYWLDRKDTQGIPPGLFEALNGRDPIPEPTPPNGSPVLNIITTIAQKPPYTAVCSPADSRTPIKPEGWRD